MKTFLEYFEEVSEMPKDELAAYVESELVEAMMDTDADIYTEATNSEAHKAMAELRQNVSALKKDMKKSDIPTSLLRFLRTALCVLTLSQSRP